MLIFSDRSKGGWPTTVNQVICGAPWRPHSQRSLRIKNRWPPDAHTKMPALKACHTAESRF